ncbi:MAG: phage integrase N-terminal SAM-like domain-containing protein [Burkholderiales bacterium]
MPAPADPSLFLQSLRETIRTRHLSIRTEEAYLHFIRRFILFHGKRQLSELGESDLTGRVHDRRFPHPRSLQNATPGCAWVSRRAREEQPFSFREKSPRRCSLRIVPTS